MNSTSCARADAGLYALASACYDLPDQIQVKTACSNPTEYHLDSDCCFRTHPAESLHLPSANQVNMLQSGMTCTHIPRITAQTDLSRLAKAAEAVFSACNRPVLRLGIETILRCCHSGCLFTSSQGVYVCTQCTRVSCHRLATQRPMKSVTDKDTTEDTVSQTHLELHFITSGHTLFLSVEHMHLYCAKCEDFVFNRYLDATIATRARVARASRSRFTSSTSPLEARVQRTMFVEESLILRMQKRRRLVTPENWTPSKRETLGISKHSRVLSSPQVEPRPPIGLVNLGNSCYMNSVLQAFLNAPPLRNFFLADQHRTICQKRERPGCLGCAIDRLVCDSCFGLHNVTGKGREDSSSSSMKVPFLVPHDILDIMWRNASHLATYAQHDAHEFLIAALNILNTHCRSDKVAEDRKLEYYDSVLPNESDAGKISTGTGFHSNLTRRVSPVSPITNVRAEQGGSFLGKGTSVGQATASIIQSLFSGTLQSDVICRVCGNSSLTLEKFYDISLDVDKFVKGSSTRRSRAQSPALGNPSAEGNHPSVCAIRANLVSSHEDRDGMRMKEDSKEASALEDQKITTPPVEPMNGNSDSHQEREIDAANSLEECLSRFTEPELLGSSSKMHCTKCGKRQESMKQMSIRTLPPIVCFHFKRFEQSFANIRRSEMIKIDTPVEFPADGMNLSKFQTTSVLMRRQRSKTLLHSKTIHSALLEAVQAKMHDRNYDIAMEDSGREEVRSNKEAVYDLFAVVNHNGRIDSGHYTAMIRKKGAWFKCDDEKVVMLPAVDEVIRSEEAYLVFYQQRYPNIQVSDPWDC